MIASLTGPDPQTSGRRSNQHRYRFLPPLALLCWAIAAWQIDKVAASSPPVWIYFDNLSAGTRVDTQYLAEGVRFANDYTVGRPFRNSPRITASAAARSAPHVLVNTAFDEEVYSSANVPLVLHFASPISGVGMQLGYVNDYGVITGATVRLFDCQGNLKAVGSALPRSDFLTPLQVLDVSGSTRLVVIDYGSAITPEAIDDLAFQLSGNDCDDLIPPVVLVTSHVDQQIVANPNISLRGRVEDASGFIARVKVNGMEVPATPHPQTNAPPVYDFEWPLVLQPGPNAVAVVAWDGSDNLGSTNLTLHYGPPATVEVKGFHLTQRGIMQTNQCDVDEPLVAGKFTIVRLELDARTVAGFSTYVESVKMSLYRRIDSLSILVATLDGTSYSPFVSWFESASEMTGIHFWIEGNLVSEPAEYSMQFDAFVGGNKVGSTMSVPCGNPFFTFAETKPLRILILPVEAPLFSPDLPERNHQLVFDQLAQVVRSYPVREGISLLDSGAQTGVRVVYSAPHPLCDGLTTNQQFCLGTGYEWTFKDAHPDGMRRAYTGDGAGVGETNCKGSPVIGGVVISNNLYHLPRRTPFGFFTPGSPAQWRPEFKFFAPLVDDNHNLILDQSDLANGIAEFRDPASGLWITNLTQYTNGMVYHSYRDLNGDYCSQDEEPVPPVVRRYLNMKNRFLWHPANYTRWVFNQQNPATPVDHSILWLAPDIHPWFEYSGFPMLGPGQGQQPGNLVWVSPRLDANGFANCNVVAHEMGHNFDLSHEVASVPAWQAYIYYRQVNAAQAFTTMNPYILHPDRSFFRTNYYRKIFDQLKVTNATASLASVERLAPALFLTGTVSTDGQLLQAEVSVGETTELTSPPRSSPWHWRLGGHGETLEQPFAVHYGDLHPETAVDPSGAFQVVIPLPEGTDWVEILQGREVVWRRDRSTHPPVVQVTQPNGGEIFTTHARVRIAWTASDPDTESLTYSVLYSPDGRAWLPVASGLRDRFYLWDADNLPGGAEARIRVVASDGFNQSSDDSDTVFQVEGKAPLAIIHSPQPDEQYLQGQFIPLRATVLDPESQTLQITWYLDDQPVASVLSVRLPPQSPGPHWLVLRVQDTQGFVVWRERGFYVLGDADRDGMSDGFEQDFGFDVSLAADALDDADGDGLTNFEESWRQLNPRERDTDGDGVPDGDEVQAGFDPRDPGSTPPCLPIPDGVISWWSGDEHAGDLTGQNPGSLEASTGFGPGKVGPAFQLNGDGGVWIENHPSLLPETFTVAAWIFPTSYEGNRVLEKGGFRVGGGYGFEFNPFGSQGIRFVVWSESPQVIDSDLTVPLFTWAHIAGTFDGTTMRLFVNGQEQTGTRQATLAGNDAPLTLGRASGGYDLFFLGAIDEVQLFGRALAGEEIAAIHGSGSSGLCKGCIGGPPWLHIEQIGDTLEIFWPRCPGWILQETEILTTPPIPWVDVSPDLYQFSGDVIHLSIPAPGGRRFYRLHLP